MDMQCNDDDDDINMYGVDRCVSSMECENERMFENNIKSTLHR